MYSKLKKIIFSLTFNLSLFLLLIVGIQNSSKREKIFFFNIQSVSLPISFIIGMSFISGTFVGDCLNFNRKKD